jgi:protein disulfide-isomerase
MKPSLQCLLLCLLAVTADARTWKEAGSDRTIVGEFVRTEGENVVITRPIGGTAKVPLSRLSEEDQKFAAEQAAAKAAPVGVFKWETDFEVAKKRAKVEKKPMLLDFTGSDWCGWCIRLKKEVFTTPEFEKYAKDNLVLVEVDFPRAKKLPKDEAEQNAKLQQEYKIEGYPTIILLNSDGKKVAGTGYLAGGPEKYIEHLKSLLK